MKKLIELEPGVLSAENFLYQLQTCKNVILENGYDENFYIKQVYVPKDFKNEHTVLFNISFWRKDAGYQSHVIYTPIHIEYVAHLKDNLISCVDDYAPLGIELLSKLINEVILV